MIRVFSAIARAIIPNSLLHMLRGRRLDGKGSVLQTQFFDRLERFSLWFHQARGGTYISWYSKRLNKSAQNQQLKKDSESNESEKRLLEYLETGYHDLDILVHYGMKPHHTLHEIGLGAGRSAQFFVDYLEADNYSGNDIAAERLRHAQEAFENKGLENKNPILICNEDNSFNWCDGRTFDFIYANSVFGHMPPEDVEEILANIRHIMRSDSAFYFTVWGRDPNIQTHRKSVKDWARNQNFWIELGKRHNYNIEHLDYKMPDNFVPKESRLLKLTFS